MTYQEQSAPFDQESQRRRFEHWRKKLALGIAISHLPKSVRDYQKRIHMHKLSVKEACQMLEEEGFKQAVKKAQQKALVVDHRHLFDRERGDLE